MEPREQRLEVEAPAPEHDELAVEDGRPGQPLERSDDLREVAAERPPVPALQLDGASVAEGEAAKPVPLRLVEVLAARELARQAREHRLDRRRDARPGALPCGFVHRA